VREAPGDEANERDRSERSDRIRLLARSCVRVRVRSWCLLCVVGRYIDTTDTYNGYGFVLVVRLFVDRFVINTDWLVGWLVH